LVTIREVAEKAGVSIGTVSRVINNKSGVGERTRHHVLEISKELGYTPHKRVPLATTQVTHLGLLIRPTENPLTSDPFYGGIFHGVEQTCQDNRINVYFSTLDIKNGRLIKLPAMISDERISGIVLLGALPYHIVKEIDDVVKVPIVLIDNYYQNCEWDSVMIENEHGAYAATKHLIDHGHRNIVMMSGPSHPSILERREGYAKAMQEHDLIPNIIKNESPSPGDGLSPSDGETGILEILKQAPDTTAVFCSNDNQALGSLVKLQRMGYSVPEDMSIVGFDDIITVNFTSPPLTTIHVDRPSLGKIATQLLFNRIENPSRAIVKSIVSTELIQRDSVAPPRTHHLLPS
jgi:DNA-binding LacI/PurR family transcriptional regulator